MDARSSSQLEVFLSAKNLPNKDTTSKSDPFAVLELKDVVSGNYKEIDRTEIINDNLSPVFAKMFLIDYFFEEHQNVRVRFFDSDSKAQDLSKHDYMGYSEFALSELVAARGQTLQLPLLNNKGKPVKKNCVVVIRGEESSSNKDTLRMTFRAEKLDKKDFFGKSDPYLEFLRLSEDGSYVKVHSSEVIKNNLNPNWKPFAISLAKFCNGDRRRPIVIKCWDWDADGTSDFIGECETTVTEMLGSKGIKWDLINKENKKKAAGTLILSSIDIQTAATFLDYIKGGCTMSLMVAIDFTGSNGDPGTPQSLHYRWAEGHNQYQQAIRTIGTILEPYDSDQMFPVWGFGGRIFGEVSHCFALTFDEAKPEVKGVNGILKAYDNSFKTVSLSGPTMFSQVIQTAIAIASEPLTQEHQHYSILLILTDGVIDDLRQTLDAIHAATDTPLSIIIIGIGDADFSQMKELDGDDVKDKRFRDIVQFVPLRDYSTEHISRLAKDTLCEVPKQFMSFMEAKKIKPGNARAAVELKDDAPPSFDALMSPGSGSPSSPVPAGPYANPTPSPSAPSPVAYPTNLGAQKPATGNASSQKTPYPTGASKP